ncbi:MAG: SBBP repeat-containing protein [Acidobacteriota bacterium]
MKFRSLRERTIRIAILVLSMVCVTSGTHPFYQVGGRDQARVTGSRASLAQQISVASILETLSQPDPATRRRLNEDFARIPMCFEANQGQAPESAQFVSASAGRRLLLNPIEATLELRQSNSAGPEDLRMHLVNADPAAQIHGLDLLPTRAHYFIGNNRDDWHTNIPTFARVICEKVYPGVDLIYYGNQRQLEYDFVVAPGADPDRIKLRFEGAQKTVLDPEGNLIVLAGGTEVRHEKPVAYQEADGERSEVPVAFSLFADGSAGFELGAYDPSRELVIDPVLVFSTYLGGSEADVGRGIFVDSGGNAYVLGDSRSPDFTNDTADGANANIFIGKFTPGGGAFAYAFFGGPKDEVATGLAIDAAGNAYISGSTQSENFAAPGSINPVLLGASDAFVAKLNPASGAFFYLTLVGGSGDESAVSIAIDAPGNAYISGKTTSTDFPTANAIQPSYGGGDSDAFISKISLDGKSLVYSTYLGGTGTENLAGRCGVAVDSAGNAYVAGDTQSGDFPLSNALRSSKSGSASSLDAYVSKIDPTGSAFVYSTYFGGDEDDFGFGIAADSSGSAYIAGRTKSTSFTGSSSTRPLVGTADAFVSKLNAAGSTVSYLTFIGAANGDESANAIVVDASGNAYVAGSAGNGLATVKSVQSYFTGGDDVLVARLSSTGTVNFSTYLGGSGDETGLAISVDPAGSIYVTGSTDSEDLLTSEAVRTENAGGTDLFVAKIDPNTDPNGPLIYNVVLIGKQLRVFGQNFSNGAFVLVNDSAKTTNGGQDPSQILHSKQAGKKAKPGKTIQIQVENANGKRSNLFFFRRPD